MARTNQIDCGCLEHGECADCRAERIQEENEWAAADREDKFQEWAMAEVDRVWNEMSEAEQEIIPSLRQWEEGYFDQLLTYSR